MKPEEIKTTFIIRPRIKKSWFTSSKVVYDLIEVKQGLEWNDPSYGNGGGTFEPFLREKKLQSFKTFFEAEKIKNIMTA